MEAKKLDLVDTIIDMLSEDANDRLRAEYQQVMIRRRKLLLFIKENPQISSEYSEILKKQINAMNMYAESLRSHAKVTNVELPFIR